MVQDRETFALQLDQS